MQVKVSEELPFCISKFDLSFYGVFDKNRIVFGCCWVLVERPKDPSMRLLNHAKEMMSQPHILLHIKCSSKPQGHAVVIVLFLTAATREEIMAG